MRKIELEVSGLTHSVSNTNNYAVVLKEMEGKRRLPIVIGSFEAQAIAVVLEEMPPHVRPLTHDLIRNIFIVLSTELKEVIINNLVEGVFYARLICNKDGKSIEIDSRTSDALALALRFKCPIYTFEFILDQAGIILDEAHEDTEKRNPPKKSGSHKESMEQKTTEELQKMLEDVLEKEEYEKAAKIHDELKKRGII